MNHTGRGVDEAAEERVRAVLDGLRTMAKPDDRAALVGTSDAQAILDDAWSMLSQVLAKGSTPDAGEVLDMLRRLSQVDHLLLRSQTANRIGEVLTRLEAGPVFGARTRRDGTGPDRRAGIRPGDHFTHRRGRVDPGAGLRC